MLIGDWSAVVGPRQAGDNDVVGRYGGAVLRNDRKSWLVEWATGQKLIIADTAYDKVLEDRSTYQNGTTKRQLDYCLVDAWFAKWITDAGTSDIIGVGLDHRAVKLELALPPSLRKGEEKINHTRNVRGWKSISETTYHAELDARLARLEGQVCFH